MHPPRAVLRTSGGIALINSIGNLGGFAGSDAYLRQVVQGLQIGATSTHF
ncbi:hypothetical protein [Bradyrhizobium prioriisuperbiae]|nr:hypothetical protein [Bradyrhizobium prioritasuperba]